MEIKSHQKVPHIQAVANTSPRAAADTAEWLRSSKVTSTARAGNCSHHSGAPLPGAFAGVIARATVDSLSPITAGILSRELPVFTNGNTVFSIPRDLRAGEALIRYAPADRVKLSGYYWPESAAKLGGSPYLWTESAGQGRVIMFAQDPVYRDQLRGTLQLFANAVLLGGTY